MTISTTREAISKRWFVLWLVLGTAFTLLSLYKEGTDHWYGIALTLFLSLIPLVIFGIYLTDIFYNWRLRSGSARAAAIAGLLVSGLVSYVAIGLMVSPI